MFEIVHLNRVIRRGLVGRAPLPPRESVRIAITLPRPPACLVMPNVCPNRRHSPTTRKAFARFTCCMILLIASLLAVCAQASSAQGRVVLLCHERRAESLEAGLAEILRTHLAELEIELEVKAAPPSSSPFDVVAAIRATPVAAQASIVTWIVPQKPRVIVYVFEPQGPHLRARAVTVSESPVVAAEELALMLRSAILARREGGALEMAEVFLPAVPPSSPRPTTVLPSPTEAGPSTGALPKAREFAFGLSGGYGYFRSISQGGGGSGLSLRLFGQTSRTRFGVGYVVLPTTTIHSDRVNVDVAMRRHPIHFFLASSLARSERLQLWGEILGGFDPTRRQTVRADAPLESTQPRWRYAWSLAGLLRGESKITAEFSLAAAVGVEFALNPYDFEAVWMDERTRLARILPVRPMGDLSLVWVTR